MSLQTFTPDCNNPVESTPDRPPTKDELVESIRSKLAAGTGQYIAAGLDFIKLKKCTGHGHFAATIEAQFDWSIDVVQKWMDIARTFPNTATWRFLPSNWTTLYVLTRLPPKTRENWIADRTISPRLTHRAAEALVRKARQSNSNGRSGEAEDHGGDGGELGEQHDVGGDGDRGEDCSGDAHCESHDEDRGAEDEPAAGAPTAVANDVGENSEGEVARKLARANELEREARCWEIRRVGYESEIEELKAKLDETSVRHQRRLFRQVLEAMGKSEAANIPAKEKRAFHNGVIIDLTEFVRSAARDGLSLTRFDLYCRPEQH